MHKVVSFYLQDLSHPEATVVNIITSVIFIFLKPNFEDKYEYFVASFSQSITLYAS